MEILIKKQRNNLRQLKIYVRPDQKTEYRIDDECGVLYVPTDQEALDSAVRYINHGIVLETPYDSVLPVLLRAQA